MRFKRFGVMVAVLAVMVGVLASVATAQSDESSEVVLHGRGQLWAKGRGHATLDMGGRLELLIRGNVALTDIAGDMTVRIVSGATSLDAPTDAAPEHHDPNVVLNDFQGLVVVTGTHFVAEAEGRMKLHARGHGIAILRGRGVYRTSGGGSGHWSDARLQID